MTHTRPASPPPGAAVLAVLTDCLDDLSVIDRAIRLARHTGGPVVVAAATGGATGWDGPARQIVHDDAAAVVGRVLPTLDASGVAYRRVAAPLPYPGDAAGTALALHRLVARHRVGYVVTGQAVRPAGGWHLLPTADRTRLYAPAG